MKKLIFILAISVMAFSCGTKDEAKSEEKTEEGNPKVSKDRLDELDNEFKTATELDAKKAKEFVGLCLAYADENPKDQKSPYYLEKGAMVAGAIGKPSLKARMFQFIIDKHADYENFSNIVYLQAVCWDTELNDRVAAKKFYQMTLEHHKDTGIISSTNARMETIDSLDFNQHVDMLIKKATQQ